MVDGASQASLSISESLDFLGITNTIVSRVYTEWYKNTEKHGVKSAFFYVNNN